MSSQYPSEEDQPTDQYGSQQPPYGYGESGQHGAAPSIPGRKGPVALLISGIACGVIAVILIVIGASMGIGGAISLSEEQELLESGEMYSLDTEPEAKYDIYLDMSTSVQCYAENPEGAPLEITAPGGNVTLNNRDRVLVVTTGPADTGMNLLCETDNGADYYIGESVSGKVGGMVAPLIIGVVLAFVAFPLTVAGIIWLVVRSRKISQARSAQGNVAN